MQCTRRRLVLVLCLMLVAVALLACTSKEEVPAGDTVTVTDGATVGEGATAFSLEIVTQDGKTVQVTVHTDEKTVGAALQTLHIIAGEEGAYGLYIKEVNGVTADYAQTGTYWAFYEDGEYAVTGVDKTAIVPTVLYTLKEEKA